MRQRREPGNLLHKTSCEACGSSDARAVYDNGTSHCFSCTANTYDDDGAQPARRRMESDNSEFIHGEYAALENRGLTKETLQKWGYQVNAERGCQIANYRDAMGELVAQKIRQAGKKFYSLGPSKKHKPLYGMWLWGKGKSITITEGEIDALSMSQAFDHKWPVVSLPDGADSAVRALEQHYEYLDQFEKIVLMFDQDEPGRKATEAAAAILPVGKVHVAVLPYKDANEVLLKAGKAALVDAFWKARPYRPDGIISGEELTVDKLMEAVAQGFPMSQPILQEKVLGWRKGELTLLTAGSGIGKSTWARQVAYELHRNHGCKIGNVFLEEGNVKTGQAYVALHNNVPLGKLRQQTGLLPREKWEEAQRDVVSQMWFYNHFGSLESTNLLSKLRYLATVCKVDFIVLDHISIVTSGMESSSEGERKDIDILMTRLVSLVEETGVGIIAIVHLKRAQGKTFNEGSQVSLNDLRGSAALEQLSYNVLALERDQQAEEQERDTSIIRVLKCRETGDTGEADNLIFNRRTGWLEVPQVAAL